MWLSTTKRIKHSSCYNREKISQSNLQIVKTAFGTIIWFEDYPLWEDDVYNGIDQKTA